MRNNPFIAYINNRQQIVKFCNQKSSFWFLLLWCNYDVKMVSFWLQCVLRILDIAAVYHSERSVILGNNGYIYTYGEITLAVILNLRLLLIFRTCKKHLHCIDAYSVILFMNELGYIDVHTIGCTEMLANFIRRSRMSRSMIFDVCHFCMPFSCF